MPHNICRKNNFEGRRDYVSGYFTQGTDKQGSLRVMADIIYDD